MQEKKEIKNGRKSFNHYFMEQGKQKVVDILLKVLRCEHKLDEEVEIQAAEFVIIVEVIDIIGKNYYQGKKS